MTTNNRLGTIEAGLEKALGANAVSELECGRLLVEAKEQLAHGEWLPWLNDHFPHSVSTATRWMAVATLLAKFPKLGNLKIAKGGFYNLAECIDEMNDGLVEKIVEAAATAGAKWLREWTVLEILNLERKRKRLEAEAKEQGVSVDEVLQQYRDKIQSEREALQTREDEHAQAEAEAERALDAPPDDDDAPPLPTEAAVDTGSPRDKGTATFLSNACRGSKESAPGRCGRSSMRRRHPTTSNVQAVSCSTSSPLANAAATLRSVPRRADDEGGL
jgi:hypothetical protein